MWGSIWEQSVAYGDPRNTPISDTQNALANSYVAGGYLRVYGWTVYSSLGSAQNIQMYDASKLPADGAVPFMNFNIGASSVQGVYYGKMGRVFKRGLVLCNSTTDTTKTIGAVNCFFDVQYDYIQVPPSSLGPDGGQ